MAIPVTNAIFILPPNLGDSGLGSQPYDTYSGQRIAIDPANATPAFEAARDALSGSGGSLWVAPGSSTYTLLSEVDWGNRPTAIAFAAGARFALGPAAVGGLRFKGPVRLEGLEVFDNWANAAARHFLMLDGTLAPDVCSDVELVNCLFSMTATGNAVADARCIRAEGFSASQRNGRLVLDGCAFVSRGGTQQAWSWVGEESTGAGTNAYIGTPYGVGLITARNWRHVQISGLSLRGRITGQVQYAGCPVLLDNVDCALLTDWTASDLSMESVGSISPLVVLRSDPGVDGIALVDDSFSELLHSDHVLHVARNMTVILRNNQAGRIIGNKVKSAFAGSGGDAVLWAENAAHNVNGALVPNSLDVSGARACAVIDNAATLRKNERKPFNVVNCGATLVAGNLALTKED